MTDQELAYRGLSRKDFNMQVGQSKLNNHQLFANVEVPLNDNWKVYTLADTASDTELREDFSEDLTKAEHLQDCIPTVICRRSEQTFRIFRFPLELKETGKAGISISAILSGRILSAMILKIPEILL